MDISFIRSSSYNCWDICQFQYYITYVLGYESISGIAANRGTVFHKMMECLAKAKYADQNNKKSISDSALGSINILTKSKPYTSNAFVDNIITKIYKFYDEQEQINFTQSDRKLLTKWVYNVIDDKKFDPRNLNIFAIEKPFDIEIKQDWAKLSNNKYLRIKGTMDLVIEHDGYLELLDWKSGKKIDWKTVTPKTFSNFMDDFQLRLYHYVLRNIYPEYKNILVTINYINDGGAISIAHDDKNIIETENRIKKRFNIIKNCKSPILKSNGTHFFCNRICQYGKEKVGKDTQCQYLYHITNALGLEKAVLELRKKGFSIDYYEKPG
jgi:hypothetical protein